MTRSASASVAPWQLRIDPLRVYSDVEEEAELVVKVRAVGIKKRNQVRGRAR